MLSVDQLLSFIIKNRDDDEKALNGLYFHLLDIQGDIQVYTSNIKQRIHSVQPTNSASVMHNGIAQYIKIGETFTETLNSQPTLLNKLCIEPLIKFIGSVNKISEENIQCIEKIIKTYKAKYIDLCNSIDKYKMACARQKDYMIRNDISNEKSKQTFDALESQVKLSEIEYKHRLNIYNEYIKSKSNDLSSACQKLCQVEEDKKAICQNTNINFSKIFNVHFDQQNELKHSIIEVGNKIEGLTSLIKEQQFISFRSNLKDAKRYSLPTPLINGNSSEAAYKADFERRISKLLRNEEIVMEDITVSLNYVQYLWGEEIMMKTLQSISQTKRMGSYENMKFLGQMINYLLVTQEQSKIYNLSLITAILSSCIRIHSFNGDLRTCLANYICNHSIWQSEKLWKLLIDFAIENRKKERAMEKRNSLPESNIKKLTGFISHIFDSDIKNGFNINSAYLIVNQYATLMSVMKVQRCYSTPILLFYSEKYNFENDKFITTLSELESSQQIEKKPVTLKDVMSQSLCKREKERKSYGYNTKVFAIGLSLKYISDLKTAYGIVQVCKSWRGIYSRRVNKMLMISDIPISKKLCIWEKYLEFHLVKLDYKLLKEKAYLVRDLKKSVDDIILMDVKRSFYNCKDFEPDALISILRTYSLLNSQLEYCQGMNYIVGYLLLIFKNEELTFKALVSIVEKMNMTSLLSNGMKTLKLYVYEIQRLTAIYIPELHQHFIEENVTPEIYASPWILTVFTNIIQFSKEYQIPPLLIAIWNFFFVEGWKGILRTVLFVLCCFKPKLMGLSFDEMIYFFNDGIKILFYNDNEAVNKYYLFMEKNKVSKELIISLEIEFKRITEIANMRSSIAYTKDTKHSIKVDGVEQIIDLI